MCALSGLACQCALKQFLSLAACCISMPSSALLFDSPPSTKQWKALKMAFEAQTPLAARGAVGDSFLRG